MATNNRSASPVDKVVGTNLRMIRTSKGISQVALAEQVAITFQQIQKYEKGVNRIGAGRLWQFCKAFDCDPSEFFAGIEKDSSPAKAAESQRTDLYQHPRGPAIAKAFLNLDNKEIENQIIAMCRALNTKKAS